MRTISRHSIDLRARDGLTLIELMVVLVILGLMAALVFPKLTGTTGKARVQTAQIQIRALEDALNQFEVENGFFPSTEQGLDALVVAPTSGREAKKWREGGYMDKTPKDPWENEYHYIEPGVNGDFDLSSFGADGVPGGEDDSKDINSWELR
jgi:general secretion pathway protein G